MKQNVTVMNRKKIVFSLSYCCHPFKQNKIHQQQIKNFKKPKNWKSINKIASWLREKINNKILIISNIFKVVMKCKKILII